MACFGNPVNFPMEYKGGKFSTQGVAASVSIANMFFMGWS